MAQGTRVVVAATKANAWRLADAVSHADQAAMVADTFAKWEPPPSRYVIFLAGPTDWSSWYGHDQPDWAGGLGGAGQQHGHRGRGPHRGGAAARTWSTLLTHELTHVTSLAGKRDGATSARLVADRGHRRVRHR